MQSGTNVVPIAVANAQGIGDANLLYVSVTVCPPNLTTGCETVPNVQVDTGSTGLRILNTAISGTLLAALPNVLNNGSVEGECAQFADGEAWGAVHSASVQLGSLTTTTAVPIQVVGDTSNAAVPSACSGAGTLEDTQASLGANGIIGIGYFLQDCGGACFTTMTQNLNYTVPVYYTCPTASTCVGQGAAANLQVSNPIASLPASFNNGNVIELPAVPETGAAAANGYLILGVGTLSNNALPSNAPLGVDDFGEISAAFNGATMAQSFIDSGSSVYFFQDSSITQCSTTSDVSGFYCPTSTFTGSVTLSGNAVYLNTYPFTFSIDSASDLFNNNLSSFAFDNLGAPISSIAVTSQSFDVGLPFFFGRSVFTVFENATASGYAGPLAAVGPAS